MVELREPLEQLIHSPRQFTAGTTFPRANEIRLYDTTLRDGEQTPGVAFSPEQKFELACMLSDAGVHMLDVGFPSAAPSERQSLKYILDAKKSGRITSEIVVMCRSNSRDIDATLDALAEMGAKPSDCSFFIFTSGSDLHLKYKIGRTLLGLEGRKAEEWLDLPVSFYREANIRMSTKAIAHARSRGVEVVEFGGEDGSRADVDYLIELAGACYEAGGARYAYPDTVGFFAPEGVDYYIPRIVAAFPKKPLVIHFHNDFGLAAYNTVRALHHGATIPTVTVNGIGERAGNAPLHTTVMILKELYGVTIPGFRYDMLGQLRLKVEQMSGLPVAAAEPIIGHNVFTHETGIHTAGITIHPAIYQVIEPDSVGGHLRFLFGKHSGTVAVEAVLKKHEETLHGAGVDINAKLVQTLLRLIKDIRERRAAKSDHADEIRAYYQNLNHLGLTEHDLVSYALVLGPELK
ncbi:MAG: homoaconitate hydratase [Vicinamibacteria bacterium]|nr:homoaconitate hydratase [Vicinamibacteria bacterium]